ncbi:MAG: hypothetical protein ABIB43_04605 [archaeon]
MELTDLMDKRQLGNYIYDRIAHPDMETRKEQLKNIGEIVIHNGFLRNELTFLYEKYFYQPKKSTEPHFYFNNKLHIINSRGDIRLLRDEDLHKGLQYLLNREIPLTIKDYEQQRSKANRRFVDLAYDNVDLMFHYVDEKAIKDTNQLNVIFGPLQALSIDGLEMDADCKSDFINHRVFKIDEKPVMNFDYVFADQAKNLLQQLFLISNSEFPGIDINIFHYGKIGIIDKGYQVGRIYVPFAALDEKKILSGEVQDIPIYNQLIDDTSAWTIFQNEIGEDALEGKTVNTVSVLRQMKKNLEKDLDAGGDFLDMEWMQMAMLDNNCSHSRLGEIRYHFAGVGSDKPLTGKTLANTIYPRSKMNKIANAYKEIIRRY